MVGGSSRYGVRTRTDCHPVVGATIALVVNDDGLPLHSGESIWFRVEAKQKRYKRVATATTAVVSSLRYTIVKQHGTYIVVIVKSVLAII